MAMRLGFPQHSESLRVSSADSAVFCAVILATAHSLLERSAGENGQLARFVSPLAKPFVFSIGYHYCLPFEPGVFGTISAQLSLILNHIVGRHSQVVIPGHGFVAAGAR